MLFDKISAKFDDVADAIWTRKDRHDIRKVAEAAAGFVVPRVEGRNRIDEVFVDYSGRHYRLLVEPID